MPTPNLVASHRLPDAATDVEDRDTSMTSNSERASSAREDADDATVMDGMEHLPQLPQRGVQVWRQRTAADKEYCEYFRSRPALVRLKSAASHPSHVRYVHFINSTSRSVQTLWLNYQGNEVAYSHLPPDTAMWQHTFEGHPWIVRDVATKRRLCLQQVDSRGHPLLVRAEPDITIKSIYRQIRDNQQVAFAQNTREGTYISIHEPPPIQWSVTSHKLFPLSFKEAVRAVLLCHAFGSREQGPLAKCLALLPKDVLLVTIFPKAAPTMWQSSDYADIEGRKAVSPVLIPVSIWDKVVVSVI